MNHREAVERQAADKYLLNELSPAERSAFEEHYFECPECAAEVEAGAAFAANARAVLAEGGDYAGRRTATGWLRPAYLITAAAALAAIAGYQELVRIPRLRKELQRLGEPRAYVAHFLRPVGQGGDQVLAVPKEALFVGLFARYPARRRMLCLRVRYPGGSSGERRFLGRRAGARFSRRPHQHPHSGFPPAVRSLHTCFTLQRGPFGNSPFRLQDTTRLRKPIP